MAQSNVMRQANRHIGYETGCSIFAPTLFASRKLSRTGSSAFLGFCGRTLNRNDVGPSLRATRVGIPARQTASTLVHDAAKKIAASKSPALLICDRSAEIESPASITC